MGGADSEQSDKTIADDEGVEMATVLEDFSTAIDSIVTKITGTNSVYDKTLLKLNELYTTMGMSQDARNAAIAQVSSQLAVSSTNAAIAAAVDIAKSAGLIAAQILTEVERKEMTIRQTEAFNDKLLTEVMKNMGGIGQMEATTGTTQAATLFAINKAMNVTLRAAGNTTLTYPES
ncbi:MAG: hypothetical protein AB7D34_01185 [Sulfurimonas sp.]